MKTKTVWLRHPNEDALENYARHKLSENESSSVEAHLLACESCQEALHSIDDFILAFKETSIPATAKVDARDRPGFGGWLRGWISFTPGRAALAGATAMLCVIALLHRPPSAPQSPAAVTLTAFRGGDPTQSAIAPAGRAVALAIEIPDVPAATQCRVAIVDAAGLPIWSGVGTALEGQLHVTEPEALGAGNYWVRLYTGGSDPIREFGLLVK